MTALIAEGRLKNRSKIEIKCDFSGSIDWVDLAYLDLKNTYETLRPFFSEKSNFPELELRLVQKFINARDVVKLDLSLFKIADDAYDPTPGIVSVLSVLNGYEYFQAKKRNTVNKRARVNSSVSIKENLHNIRRQPKEPVPKNTFITRLEYQISELASMKLFRAHLLRF